MDEALIRTAAHRLAPASLVVVLTGAGISRESGLSTFRDPQDGLWAQYDPMDMATAEAYLRRPRLVWDWYEYRFGMARDAQPNGGHLSIAALESLFPQVTVLTQNIDGLHQRAGSTDVVELHGSMHRYRCIDGHTGFTRSDFQDQAFLPPRWPRCQALLRPEVVWFGETLPPQALERAVTLSRTCSAMIVVGTSGQVQPAASLPVLAARAGALVVDVNLHQSDRSPAAEIFLEGAAGEVLPLLLEELRGPAGLSPSLHVPGPRRPAA